jgi:hypothetical protein
MTMNIKPRSESPEDIILWPDGTKCFAYERHEYTHMSDDYERIEFGSDRWAQLVDLDLP